MRLWSTAMAALVWALLVAPAPSVAAPARVRLIRPANCGAMLRELSARTAGEVAAAGFSVDLQESWPGTPMTDPGEIAVASISISTSIADAGAGGRADAMLFEITLGRERIYRAIVAPDPAGSAADNGRALTAAAVHAVAILQSALLARAPHATSSAPSPPPAGTLREPASRRSKKVGAGLGISSLQSLQGIGLTFAPTAQISVRLTPSVRLQIAATAFGTSVSATASAGTARVRQDLVVADLSFAFRPGARVHPVVTGGAGLYHIGLEGTGAQPFVGQSAGFWAAAGEVGAGISVDLNDRAALIFESHAVVVWPQPSVKIDTVEVGRAGRPTLTQTFGVLVWL